MSLPLMAVSATVQLRFALDTRPRITSRVLRLVVKKPEINRRDLPYQVLIHAARDLTLRAHREAPTKLKHP